MYRLIYCLRIAFDRSATGSRMELAVPLDCHGCHKRIRPRPPKRRVVGLRVGDQFLHDNQWLTVDEIYVDSETVLTDEQAAAHRASGSNDGWLVKAPEGYVSPLTGGSRRRDGR